jgi:hypothetical protein
LNSSKKKNEWTLLILTHSNDQEFYEEKLAEVSINSEIVNVPSHDNYMTKVKYAIDFSERSETPYLMKCDNDIYITPQTLDYMIDNLTILDNSTHLTLGPTLSSGIPGIEYFMEQFLSLAEQETLKKFFLEARIYNRDGVIYKPLNKHTIGSEIWNKKAFFDDVKKISHHYKGIHPIRVNYDAIQYLNTCILENKEKFFTKNPTGLILNDSSPYLCDSVFCIRTDIYKKIINDEKLFVDGYDEVPLNKYAWNNSMNHVFVENGFAIHILYNWYNNIFEYENDFTIKLFS